MKEKKDLVTYRIERAKETLEEAKHNATMDFWNLVANRLYYSCYYAVQALLINDGHSVKTHSGNKILFHKHYIKTGLLPVDFGFLYSDLFDKRQEGDYEDFIKFHKEEIQPYLAEVEKFINLIVCLIEK